MTPDPAILAPLRRCLPDGVGLGWADPRADHPDPGIPAPANAVPKRLREFRAGRFAARVAIQSAGLPFAPMPMAADRSPLWPTGVVGSITHSDDHCLAVAGPSARYRGLGLDLEPALPLAPDLWETILTAAELAEITQQANPGLIAKRIFVAKEAAYKAQYPLSTTLFDFHTLAVTLLPHGFTATFLRAIPPFPVGTQIHGQMIETDGHILALAQL